jgi:hypothetical protein
VRWRSRATQRRCRECRTGTASSRSSSGRGAGLLPIMGGGEVGSSRGQRARRAGSRSRPRGARASAEPRPDRGQGLVHLGIRSSPRARAIGRSAAGRGLASADIWIAKITIKIELLAAIKVLGNGTKEALGQAKFAAEISVCCSSPSASSTASSTRGRCRDAGRRRSRGAVRW